MLCRVVVFCVFLFSSSASATSQDHPATVDALAALSVEQSAWVDDVPVSARLFGSVRLIRVDVYAAQARVVVADGHGYRELPRSDWRHYVTDGSDTNAPLLALSISPSGGEATGLIIEGDAFLDVRGARVDGDWRWQVALAETRAHAEHEPACAGAPPLPASIAGAAQLQQRMIVPVAPNDALRQAIVAVDTDNELLLRRFNNRLGDARDYIAQLFAQLNLMYERDLRVRLVQGLVILRPSSTPDPFTEQANDSRATSPQLREFGLWWEQNQANTERAFAALLSGKAQDPELNSGIAWLLGSGKYCALRGANGGAYSINLLRTAASAPPSGEVRIVGHELGHNFGAPHTHCTDTDPNVPGLQPIDRCYSGESAQGCYVGPISCPSGPGTIMSYCDAGGGAHCGMQQRFAPFHVQLLSARIAENFPSCITPVGVPDLVLRAGFE